jgi:hypothetical protein
MTERKRKMAEIKDDCFIVEAGEPFIKCNEETKRVILKDQARLRKLKQILDINSVGWANPKALIDTIRREVIYK